MTTELHAPHHPTPDQAASGSELRPPLRLPDSRPSRSTTIPNDRESLHPSAVLPPTKHQLAFMIWLAVLPTLTILNLALAEWLRALPPVLRTFTLVTMAVPIVNYVLMPRLYRLRSRLVRRGAQM